MKLIMLRANKGWLQADLAKKAKVQQSIISRIESGHDKDFSVKTMFAIAQALGVQVTDIDEFVERLGKADPQPTFERLGAA
ncbi:MAG: helix-turn-helix transcriptional regulator [Taibaiella sp.]|nr:helix-turn-helix transcriptional regulator [Taibaiella sp.]